MIKRDLERGLGIPREITLDPWAVERLYEWGATDEFVRVLADVLPQYSYKGTVQRLSWWHERNEAFLAGGDRGDEIGLFPHWYNVGFGYGQCGELAGQLRTNQVFLSALEDLNLDLSRRGRNRIELYECWGRSREFFCVPPLRHVWNGLLPEGVSPWEIVDVDVAMGRVDVGTHVMEDCRKRSWWQHPLTASFTVLPWEYKDNMDLVRLGAKVLGLSMDDQRVLSVGLMRAEELIGYVMVTDRRGSQKLISEPTGGEGWQREADELLERMNQVRWNPDLGQFPYDLRSDRAFGMMVDMG